MRDSCLVPARRVFCLELSNIYYNHRDNLVLTGARWGATAATRSASGPPDARTPSPLLHTVRLGDGRTLRATGSAGSFVTAWLLEPTVNSTVSWPLRHRGRFACTWPLERRTAGCVLFVTCYCYLLGSNNTGPASDPLSLSRDESYVVYVVASALRTRQAILGRCSCELQPAVPA